MADAIAAPVAAETLRDFCIRVFRKLHMADEDARITADILIAADLRGVDSHGVAHLRRYAQGLSNGRIRPRPEVQVIHETPATARIDAGAGMGHPVSYHAMQKALDKAREFGTGFVTVRNSNHFGIAGYYAMMALDHDCIGMAMTNAGPAVVPTFGRQGMLGTNPIALAAPAGEEWPYVLDMATSVVPCGKLEIASRLDRPISPELAVDETGAPCSDPKRVLQNIGNRTGGGIHPLGGAGEELSGHKGYGLAMLVEIMCAGLSGAAFGYDVRGALTGGRTEPPNVGHFFGAWRVDAFRPVKEFGAALDGLERQLRNSPKAAGHDRIYIPGEKEWENHERRSRKGIPLNAKVRAELLAIGEELGVEVEL